MDPTAPPEHNIYAPPESAPAVSPLSGSSYYVAGDLLFCRSPTVLPDRCVKTNASGAGLVRKTRTFSWVHQAVYLSILVNIILLLVLYLCLKKRCKITYSITKEVRRQLFLYNCLAVAGVVSGFLFMFGGIFAAFEIEPPAIGVGIALLGAAALVTGIVFNTKSAPVRIKKVQDGWFQIASLSPAFLADIDAEVEGNRRQLERDIGA